MALSWPLTVLVTALVALLCSMCIYTEFEYTLRVPVRTTPDKAYKLMSDPMIFMDLHPPMVKLTITSQQRIVEPPGEYFEMLAVERVPVIGEHTFRAQVWYNTEARRIHITAHLLWGLMTANVTWTVFCEGDADPQSCHLQENTVTSLPWVLSSQVQAEMEQSHRKLLQSAQRTIEQRNTNSEKTPEATHEDEYDHDVFF